MRHLIPIEKTMVVLDTGPARNLAHEEVCPTWVDTFEKMANSGYSFSLSEIAVAELSAQYHRQSIKPLMHKRMISRLEKFLNLEMPVVAGKQDTYGMIGLTTEPWSPIETWIIAQCAWYWLKNPEDPEAPSADFIRQSLDEERLEWISYLKKIDGIATPIYEDGGHAALVRETNQIIDQIDALTPLELSGITLAQRCHLHTRYRWRQYVYTKKPKDAYNPESKKKRNDGIDVDLFPYLMLPSFVLTTDEGYSEEKLYDIESFQKIWFSKAADFAALWDNGKFPRLEWPR